MTGNASAADTEPETEPEAEIEGSVVELDDVVRALAHCFIQAGRQLERCEDEFLASLLQSAGTAEIDGRGSPVPSGDDDVAEVTLLALVASRRHRLVALTVEVNCRFEEVETADGLRLGLYPVNDEPGRPGVHQLQIFIAGDTLAVDANLRIDGRLLRMLRVADEVDAGWSPTARILLVTPADAAVLPVARRMDQAAGG